MIVTRTPLRVSFAGGGTDLPAWYQKGEHGAVVNCAIGKYIYITANRRFDHRKTRVSYSVTEIVENVMEIKHDLVREALRKVGINSGIEITSVADVPGRGTGLGSSSSYTVGVLNALATYLGIHVDPQWLASSACEVELVKLRQPGGKQDQYAAAFGGLNYMRFESNGKVDVQRIDVSGETLQRMDRTFAIYYTGLHRRSVDLLKYKAKRIRVSNHIQSEMRAMVGLASQARDALLSGDLGTLAYIMDEGWTRKRRISDRVTTPEIDAMYERALKAGSLGGRLLGAGGGGFLLVHVPDGELEVMDQAINMKRMPVMYGVGGSQVVYDDQRRKQGFNGPD